MRKLLIQKKYRPMCEHVAFLPVVRLDSASSNRICPPTSGDIASTAGTFSISTPHPRGVGFWVTNEGEGGAPPWERIWGWG